VKIANLKKEVEMKKASDLFNGNSYREIESEIGGQEEELKSVSTTDSDIINAIENALDGGRANISQIEKLLDQDHKDIFKDLEKFRKLDDILKVFDFSSAINFSESKKKFFENKQFFANKPEGLVIGCALWLKGLILEHNGEKQVSRLCIQAAEKEAIFGPAIMKSNIKCFVEDFPIDRLAIAALRGSGKAVKMLKLRLAEADDADYAIAGYAALHCNAFSLKEKNEIEKKFLEMKSKVYNNKVLDKKEISRDEAIVLFYTATYFLKDQGTWHVYAYSAPIKIERLAPIELEVLAKQQGELLRSVINADSFLAKSQKDYYLTIIPDPTQTDSSSCSLM
jgi:hypothetical protein